jgi:hypothetical protein
MSDNKYAKEIKKTGYVLESNVGDMLRRCGWTVISNKYYEDDFEGSVREIDLLAYKVSKVQHVDVYTTLLISCKKSEADIWALLARSINLKDPNSDWWPLHAWSNDKAIEYELSKSGMAKNYHDDLIKLGVKETLSMPKSEVFAFQEMNRVSGAPHNDKNIFAAVTSLIKAQAYEIGALSHRKKSPSVYQFNLISLIESDLFRLNIDGENISEEKIDSEHYISRYIIKRNESFSRIRFVAASSFKEKLNDYGQHHEANCKWFDKTVNTFYEEILKDYRRVNVYVEKFRSKVGWLIYWTVKQELGTQISQETISVAWNKKGEYAEVTLVDDGLVIESLNRNTELKQKVSAALEEVYRYSGEFHFAVDDIPF